MTRSKTAPWRHGVRRSKSLDSLTARKHSQQGQGKKCHAHPRSKGVTFKAVVALPWTQWWPPMARAQCLHTSKTRSYFMLKASYLSQDHSRQPIKPCQFVRLTPQHDPAHPPFPAPSFHSPLLSLLVQSTIHVPSGTAAVSTASTQEGNTMIRR